MSGVRRDVHSDARGDAPSVTLRDAHGDALRDTPSDAPSDALRDLLTVIILTHNREAELQRTLERMLALPWCPPIVVVDNGSTDATAVMVQAHFTDVRLLRMPFNMGAAARNAGVLAVHTPYVAFCDDDTWWERGALEHALTLLQHHPRVAVVCARVVVGSSRVEDPVCALMASSPLPAAGLPGPALLGFLAGASVVRRSAFVAVGGYEPRLFIGGEEALMSLDLMVSGWDIVYAPGATVRHFPSRRRDAAGRRKLLVRNALWVAWMRLPCALLVRECTRLLRPMLRDPAVGAGLVAALAGLPWALRRRRVVPARVERLYRLLHG